MTFRRQLLGILGALVLSFVLPGTVSADFIDHFANVDDVGDAKVPATGASRILVIPLEVVGDGFPPLDMEGIQRFFDPDTRGEFAFTEYFERMSLGLYSPTAEVADIVRFDGCPLPEDYFGFDDCTIPRGGGATPTQALESLDNGKAMVELVFDLLNSEQELDFSRFDTNGPGGQPDGWIDGVLLIHNIGFGGIAFPLYWLREQVDMEEPLVYNGIKINIVGVARDTAVGVHEFGHLLGWADLYDESDKTKGLQYSLMGSWNYVEPVHGVDAFSRIQVGWTTPTVYGEGQEARDVRLRPAADTGDVIQLGIGEEYFLVENRGPVGDDYIDGRVRVNGLAVYHVNLKRLPSILDDQWPLRMLSCVNCFPWDPMLMNEQADGRFDLQTPGDRRDDAGDLFQPGDSFGPSLGNTMPLGPSNPEFSSNRYDGAVTGVTLTNIRADGDDFLVDVAVYEPCSLLTTCLCEDGRCVGELPPSDPEEMNDVDRDPVPEEVPEEMAPQQPGADDGCQISNLRATTVDYGVGLMWPLMLGFLWCKRRSGR